MKRPTAKEVLTVPNAMSAAGLGLVVGGSIEADPVKSLLYTAGGRALDLADGAAARALDQSSDFGAGIDALFDKLGMAAIVGGGIYHGRIPNAAGAAIVAHNSFNAAASIAHEIRHPNEQARPSKLGKIGLFVENIAMLSYLASNALESRQPSSRAAKGLKVAGHALTACGVGLGMIAGAGYVRRASRPTADTQ